MKLDELLGEDLYKQVQAKIDEKNAAEPDQLKHIRYADLSEGEYISKLKHGAEVERLNGLISGKDGEIANAEKLINELKKANKDDEALQDKIKEYETENTRLMSELEEVKIASALKAALLGARADDVDYLSYKLKAGLKESGKSIELDDEGNIKGWNDMLTELKTQFPKQFESDGGRKIIENRLPGGEPGRNTEPKNLAEALKQQYENNE